jgi:mono/diheme cytochrome c family protein
MRRTSHFVCVLALVAVFAPVLYAVQLAAQNTSSSMPDKRREAPKKPANAVMGGEQIFQSNCARCHAVPEGFSPRISGTLLRHMRVRANLSQHDERELLHFFNP